MSTPAALAYDVSGPNFLAGQVFSSVAPGQNVSPLGSFFGPGPVSMPMGANAQHYVSHDDLPAAYREARTNIFLETVVNGLVPVDLDFMLTLVFPLVYSDGMTYEWSVMTFNKPLASVVPHEGVSRRMKYTRERRFKSVHRNGLSIPVETDFMTTQMGMETYVLSLQQMRISIQTTMALDALFVIFTEPYLNREAWEIAYGYKTMDTVARIKSEIDVYGIIQRRGQDGLRQLVSDAQVHASRVGTTFDVAIVPTGMSRYLAHGGDNKSLTYMFTGPTGVSQRMQGPRGFLNQDGVSFYEIPAVDAMSGDDVIAVTEFMTTVGEHYQLTDSDAQSVEMVSHSAAVPYSNHERAIQVYDQNQDMFRPITLGQCLENCFRFDAKTGELDPMHATLADTGMGSGNKTLDMFIWRDRKLVPHPAVYVGQMEGTDVGPLPWSTVRKTATSAFSGMTKSDIELIDRALRSVTRQPAANTDLAFATQRDALEKVAEFKGFKAAFERLHDNLVRRFGKTNAVLSAGRVMYLPSADRELTESEKGQATLFYSLLQVPVGLYLNNTAKGAKIYNLPFSDDQYAPETLKALAPDGLPEPVQQALNAAMKEIAARAPPANATPEQIAAFNFETFKRRLVVVLVLKHGANAVAAQEALVDISSNMATSAIPETLFDDVGKEELGKIKAYTGADQKLELRRLGAAEMEEGQYLVLDKEDGRIRGFKSVGKADAQAVKEIPYGSYAADFSHVYHGEHQGSGGSGLSRFSEASGIIVGQAAMIGAGAARTVDAQLADLLATAPRNDAEVAEIGNCPPLQSNMAKAFDETSTTMRACLLATLFTRLRKDSLSAMIESNTYCWFGFLVFKPWIRHVMSSMAIMRSGPQTGVTAFGHAKVEMNQDAQVGMMEAFVRFYYAAILKNEQNIMLQRYVFFRRYLGGCNNVWLTDSSLNALKGNQFIHALKRDEMGASMFAVMVPAHENNFPVYMDIRGRLELPGGADDPYAPEEGDLHYSTAQYYKVRLGLDSIPTIEPGYMHFNRFNPQSNTLVCQGAQQMFDPRTRQWSEPRTNMGHLGVTRPGVRALRNGEVVSMASIMATNVALTVA